MSAYPNLPDEPVIHTCPHCDFCGNEATEERIHLGDGGTITIRMLLCDRPDCLEAARLIVSEVQQRFELPEEPKKAA